jgi:hypothetical protein
MCFDYESPVGLYFTIIAAKTLLEFTVYLQIPEYL